MNRAVPTVLILVVILGVLAGVSAVAADDGGNTTYENESAEERIEELEEKNAELESEIVDLESEIDDLEFQLENMDGDTDIAAVRSEMKRLGAWHPDDDVPAVLVVREQDPHEDDPDERYGVFYYVGPGNGEVDFNGREAWDRLNLEEIGEGQFPPIRVELPYAPEDVDTTYEFANSRAPIELRNIESDINSQAEETFIAWSQWNNEQREEAETIRSGFYLGGGVVALIGIVFASWVEARGNRLQNWLQERQLKRDHPDFVNTPEKSWKDWIPHILIGCLFLIGILWWLGLV